MVFTAQLTAYIGLHNKCAGDHSHIDKRNGKTDNVEDVEIYTAALKCRKLCKVDQRCHIHKGYDCCRRQTDMARRYPDDDPLGCLGSHSVALTVGLSMQSHHQHKIPAMTKTSGVDMTTGAMTGS